VGQWLVFDAPAKGLGVDAEAVASYVRAIPGAFDKQAAFGALMTGLNGRQAVAVTPSIKKNTVVAPQLRSATALPMTEYNYCLGDNADLKTVSAMVLGQSSGWGLGGRVAYKVVAGNCSFRLQVANTAAMKALDPACERQTSCRIHNDLAISEASWAVAPAGWDGGLASYRAELVNHVVGQWLGFTHPACTAVAEQTPTLESPAVVIPGCSAKWYAVPVELQDTKVLGGF
jgi:hypothetical protein